MQMPQPRRAIGKMTTKSKSTAVHRKSPVVEWSRLAGHPATVRRAFLTALIVGSVLILINHGAAIVSGEVTRARVFQMCLTVLVP
jgi:hypothetical protein